MKYSFLKSLIANGVVLAMVVWLCRAFGMSAEHLESAFWVQLVVQVLANELWLYTGALPGMLAALFSRRKNEERSFRLMMKLFSFVLVAGPAFVYVVLYLLRGLVGEWITVPLDGVLFGASLAGQFCLVVLVWVCGVMPICPSAIFNMLDDAGEEKNVVRIRGFKRK